MSNIIKLLPDSVANQIAAGEVIQRPASCIKELVENAVDAGAQNIQVEVKNAGRTFIHIVDDGCGMSATDARMAFERHATSKISDAKDIFQIQTKGFRGEALASIAAVAQVELKTKRVEDELGTKINIEGSDLKNQEPVQAPNGTSFLIKNLFYNIPARRNFLKSDTVEFKHIVEEFLRIAMAHPSVSFSLAHNGQTIFQLRPGNQKQRIVAAMGGKYNEKLVPVEQDTPVMELSGFVGKPQYAKRTRGEQYLFVNNRFIKSAFINHAITSCYEDLLEKGSFPSYFLFLTVDPASIDINIHPTKTEVKFTDEKTIYALVNAAVRQSLGMFNVKPTLDFETESPVELTPLSNKDQVKMPEVSFNPNYNPFERTITSPSGGGTSRSGGMGFSKASPAASTDELLKIQREFTLPLEKEVEQIQEDERLESTSSEKEEGFDYGESLFIQVNQRYISSAIKSGYVLIDQSRAHERVLYEKLLASMRNNNPSVQTSMFPEEIHFSPVDYALLLEIKEDLKKAGLVLEQSDDNGFLVNGLPAAIPNINATKFVEGVLECIKNERSDNQHDVQEKVAFSLAKSGCIRPGRKLRQEEMSKLVNDLFSCEAPNYTARGKVVMLTFTNEEIDKRFNP